mmetsp:Transcript_20248/g.48686  ORF Transcript_20248/g.48686 Transcript_20248/m.48686 type:complete len:82 (+) Transcript_20248:310-555(+)
MGGGATVDTGATTAGGGRAMGPSWAIIEGDATTIGSAAGAAMPIGAMGGGTIATAGAIGGGTMAGGATVITAGATGGGTTA